jgi:hypothetical protein
MWVKSCPLWGSNEKLRLSDSLPGQCGWEWQGHTNRGPGCNPVNSMRESLRERAGLTVAKVIEFYIPTNFRKSVKWASPEQRGKIIEFAPQVKKSA